MKLQAVSPLRSDFMNQSFPLPLPFKGIAVKGSNSLQFCSKSILGFVSSLELGSMKAVM